MGTYRPLQHYGGIVVLGGSEKIQKEVYSCYNSSISIWHSYGIYTAILCCEQVI